MSIIQLQQQRLQARVHDWVKSGAAAPEKSVRLAGVLYLSEGGWLLLNVPNALVRGAFSALDEPGIELPLREGRLNAHISVMRPEEIEQIGGPDKLLKDRGGIFHYTLGPVESVAPEGWKEMSKVWFIKVDSPELRQLRKSHGLTPLPKMNEYDFHITVAVRKKKVLQDNDVAKTSEERLLEELAQKLSEAPVLAKPKTDYTAFGLPTQRAMLGVDMAATKPPQIHTVPQSSQDTIRKTMAQVHPNLVRDFTHFVHGQNYRGVQPPVARQTLANSAAAQDYDPQSLKAIEQSGEVLKQRLGGHQLAPIRAYPGGATGPSNAYENTQSDVNNAGLASEGLNAVQTGHHEVQHVMQPGGTAEERMQQAVKYEANPDRPQYPEVPDPANFVKQRPPGLWQTILGKQYHDSPGFDAAYQKYVADHEGARRASHEWANTVVGPRQEATIEAGPSIGDLLMQGEVAKRTTGKPLNAGINFPSGKTQDVNQMVEQGRQHGFFGGTSPSGEPVPGRHMDDLLATQPGQQWLRHALEGNTEKPNPWLPTTPQQTAVPPSPAPGTPDLRGVMDQEMPSNYDPAAVEALKQSDTVLKDVQELVDGDNVFKDFDGGYGYVMWDPDSKRLHLVTGDWYENEPVREAKALLENIAGVDEVTADAEHFDRHTTWTKIKRDGKPVEIEKLSAEVLSPALASSLADANQKLVWKEDPREKTLRKLHNARMYSDMGLYNVKQKIIRDMMAEAPQDWIVDQPDKYHPGITHVPTGYRLHIDRASIPTTVVANKHVKKAISMELVARAAKVALTRSPERMAKFAARLSKWMKWSAAREAKIKQANTSMIEQSAWGTPINFSGNKGWLQNILDHVGKIRDTFKTRVRGRQFAQDLGEVNNLPGKFQNLRNIVNGVDTITPHPYDRMVNKFAAERKQEVPMIVPLTGLASGVASVPLWQRTGEVASRVHKELRDFTPNNFGLKNYKPQMGDYYLYNWPHGKPDRTMAMLQGAPDLEHASIGLPDVNNQIYATMPNVTSPTPRPPNPRAAIAMRVLQQQKDDIVNKGWRSLKSPQELAGDVGQHLRNYMRDDVKDFKGYSPEYIRESLNSENEWLPYQRQLKGDKQVGNVRIFRPKVPLTPAEKTRMWGNISEAANYTIEEPGKLEGALRNLLPVGNNSSGHAPMMCSGGVCTAYKGIRKMPSPNAALPADLTHLDDFEEVVRHVTKGGIKPNFWRTARYGLGSVAGRAGLAGIVSAPAIMSLAHIMQRNRLPRRTSDIILGRRGPWFASPTPHNELRALVNRGKS